jgi:hypothetical protein
MRVPDAVQRNTSRWRAACCATPGTRAPFAIGSGYTNGI